MKISLLFITLGIILSSVSGNEDDTSLVIIDPENIDADNPSQRTVTNESPVKLDRSFKDEEGYNSEPFIPTKEWQVVKKGQSIPAGLHVRMNFQTHVREAKLMDGDDGARFNRNKNLKDANAGKFGIKNEKQNAEFAQSAAEGPKIVLGDDLKKEDSFGDPDRLYFTKSHLKEALKDFRDKFQNEDLKTDEQEITRAEAVKKKFRSIEEIRKELGDSFGFQIKSDAQIMKLKLELLRSPNSTEQELSIVLDDLENYVHQIDNAVDLEKMGGFELIISYLNHSVATLQEKAAKVIGSAVQSNPKAQAAALEHEAMPHLLRLISYASNERLRKTCTFALSAMIRNNPSAQVVFLKMNGLSHVMDLMNSNNNYDSSNNNKASPALVSKFVTLISDLIIEQEDAKRQMIQQGRMQQNERTPLMKALVAKGWCETLPRQLGDKDNDRLEKLLVAIHASTQGCKENFSKTDLKARLNDMKQRYYDEISKEMDADFQSYLRTFPDQIEKIFKNL
eukprot:gene5152-5802_t